MRWVSQAFPRGLHVDATQGCVMLTLGRAKQIRPGFRFYWPPIQRPIVHPIKRDTLKLAPQTLPCEGDKPVGITISVTVVYTIADVMKALVETYDFTATVTDRAQACVIESCVGKPIDMLVRKHQHINSSLTKKIRKALEPYGVSVEHAFMSDFHITNMHRVYGSTTVLPIDSGYEEVSDV